MITPVSATRMEMLRLARREKVARRGHKLLKDKLDELIRVMLDLIRQIEEDDRDISRLRKDHGAMMALADLAGVPRTASAALISPTAPLSIGTDRKRILNLSVPVFRVIAGDTTAGYGSAQTSAALDRAGELFLERVRREVDMAGKEAAVRILAREITATRRRVNALEYILIPDIVSTRKRIAMKLDERERDTRVRLMRVKDVIRAPLSPTTAFPGTPRPDF
ncbi:V-type ATP synthase subunit D [Desulfatiferula olefinivorans]